MAAPTNLTALTAIDLGATLPIAITQDVHDAGTTYTVWYKRTAQAGENVLGLWGFGDLTIYKPDTAIFLGPAAAPVPLLFIQTSDNKCCQFPVTPGTTYYFRFRTNAGNPTPANLTISLLAHADVPVPPGSIGVNDDLSGFPMAFLASSGATVSMLRFLQGFPPGERATTWDDGTFAIEDSDTGATMILSAAYAVLGVVANSGRALASNRVDRFYTMRVSGVTHVCLTILNTGAVVSTTSSVANSPASVDAIAVSPDGTILYYFEQAGTTVVHRWDLVNDVALSDLGTFGRLCMDAYCLADGRVVLVDSIAHQLLLLNPDGTTSVAYTFAANLGDRFCRGLTDATCWIWNKQGIGDDEENFKEIRLSDGVVLQTIHGEMFIAGSNASAVSASPQRFGNSNSCPFWIVPVAFSPGTPGRVVVSKVTHPLTDTTLFAFTASGGLAPTSFSLPNGVSQLFEGVPPGAGYGVVETPNAAYTTTVHVSNGSPATNLTVAEGETVTVVFTNTQIVPAGQPGCPLGYPDAVTGRDGCANTDL